MTTAGFPSKERVDALVGTDWLLAHLDDPKLVVLEVDDRPALYHRGHIPRALPVSWTRDLQDPVRRDLPDASAIGALWRRLGIRRDSIVVLYGDLHNWLAAYGYWLFRAYGLTGVRLLDGGRQRWLTQELPLTTSTESSVTDVPALRPKLNVDFRADRHRVVDAVHNGCLLDVRTPQEYSGEWLTEPEYRGEAAHRPGHIPGATHLAWDNVVAPDGRIRPIEELEVLFRQAGVSPTQPVVTYCRIGERSAHTWIVLHDLLGHPDVRNYDGSWTEWGSMTGMPIELGTNAGTFPAMLVP